MSKIDPRLKYLQMQWKSGSDMRALESLCCFGLTAENVQVPKMRVLVQFSGDAADLKKNGLEITSSAGDVHAGLIASDKIDALDLMAGVSRIESSRPLSSELDISVPEIRANLVHTGPPGHRGAGVIIGIIDTGIDWQHPCFRRPDGTSRILRIWDQGLLKREGTEQCPKCPKKFNYGVEYTQADIDAALTSTNPAQLVPHQDEDDGHGTHVTGIAAGSGSVAGNNQPAYTYPGVSPEADIVVVKNSLNVAGRVSGKNLGDSANTLDAVNYIFGLAKTLKRPVVINMSQGDNLGPHDGTSLLERGIDNLLGRPGLAFVKSAGNEGDHNRHASGTVASGATERVRFKVFPGNLWLEIDIWYAGTDRFTFSITSPDGNTSAIVDTKNSKNLDMPNGNVVFVDSVLNDPHNNDNRIYVRITYGKIKTIQEGSWTINLTGARVANGRFHAWIERHGFSQFQAPHVNNESTISIPGTARKVITVASYVTKEGSAGSISEFSSRGPTRDGRATPTIAAPGEWIMSARAQGINHGEDQYHLISGTSMAAPHVTGVIALMLQANPNLTQDQIRNYLTTTARNDEFTGATPNTTWGAGKIDAKAAFDRASRSAASEQAELSENSGTGNFYDDSVKQFNKILDDLRIPQFTDIPKMELPDIPEIKLPDIPGIHKFCDDLKRSSILDLIKSPVFDKQSGSDLDNLPPVRPERSSEAVSSIPATPRHSMAGSRSRPEAFDAMSAEYEARIAEYEKALTDIDALLQKGQLSADQSQQIEALRRKYTALLKEHRSLSQSNREPPPKKQSS